MRLLGQLKLSEFMRRHSDIRSPLEAWICEVEDAIWKGPADVKARYPSASFLSENRVIFNIKGNKYRLETKISYDVDVVLVTWIGTHADYSKREY